MNPKVITFDVYSALTDLKGSVVQELQNVLQDENIHYPTMFQMWRDRQWNYLLITNSLQKGYVSYHTLTTRALEYTLNQYKIDLTEQEKEQLVAGWSRLKLWPEAEQILMRLREKGYKLGMLSNGDEYMLRTLDQTFNFSFDYIFSSDQAGVYKPSAEIYQLPLNLLEISPEEVLHVAGSYIDVMGTKSAGLPCVWTNRLNDTIFDPAYAPDYELKNLEGLLQFL
ncbi:haloacid dehalogenase type II [Ornithinibacillus sp. 4-3]|uniref:Haloacid dehalogenase type II n=1 Tax=Ornithinibacillus sp. 4-3 TaxID=3231488 RepID=A0AB39HUU8_9BACI